MTTPGYVSKTDLVAALIRELVITGELEPGEQLRQRDLAQRFGVSQTPVREAMRRLQRTCLGKLQDQDTVGEDDLKLLMQAGGELFALNFVEGQHRRRISHEGHKGHKVFSSLVSVVTSV